MHPRGLSNNGFSHRDGYNNINDGYDYPGSSAATPRCPSPFVVIWAAAFKVNTNSSRALLLSTSSRP